MSEPYQNLKSLLRRLDLSNLAVAQATGINPSTVSRILSGQRKLTVTNPHAADLVDYLLSQCQRVADIDWLKEQFTAAGLPGDPFGVSQFKQNLLMWIASDGRVVRRSLRLGSPPSIAGDPAPLLLKGKPDDLQCLDGSLWTGIVPLVIALRPALEKLAKGSAIHLFLSNDRLMTTVDARFAALMEEMIEENDLYIHMVVCVSGDTQATSRLMDRYLHALISGHVKLSVVHGMTQPITSTLHILLPGKSCFLVHETIGAAAEPVTLLTEERAFVEETEKNFERTTRYAQPVLKVLDDNYSRDVIEILAMEYCTPGGLDVVKDSVNPLFMSCEAFNRFLATRGHTPEEYAWRSAEFARLKAGMNANLQSGVPFREILSLARLNEIVRRASCPMAGLYFAELGYVALDREGCLDILNGYIDYLTHEPNFSLLIVDDLDELHGNNCWHIKRDGHISINNWQGKSPVMIYSDQLMLLREFQTRYDALWTQGARGIGSRANVISILKDVTGRMEMIHS